MPFRKPTRLRTFDYSGEYRYSLTFCTDQRRQVFTAGSIVNGVLLHFRQHADADRIAILAYCFMPDHVHLLAAGLESTSNVGRFVTRAKQASGYWYARSHGERLWQRYAWDRVLRAEDDTMQVMRYLLANPVRGGLVKNPLDYPFSGSLVYAREDLVEAFLAPDRAG